MTFTVVYDANVLYPNTLRDLLIRIAQSGTVQAKWTNAILDEMSRALRRNRPDIPEEKLERLRDLMNKAVRDCLVASYEPLIAGAQVIVTRNLKDFPESDLGPWNVEAKSPDAFVLDQVHQRPSSGGLRPADRGLPDQPARSSRRRTGPTGTRRPRGVRRSPPRRLARQGP